MSDSKIQTRRQGGPADINSQESAFLLTAKDKLTAGAYEEMLRKNKIIVTIEHRETNNPYGVVIESGGQAVSSPFNLYVWSDQLDRARELVQMFDDQPIVYKSPLPRLNRKSRSSQILFGFVLFLVIVIPIAVSVYAIGKGIFRFFT